MEREETSNLQVEAFDYVQYSLRRYHNHQLNGCLHMNGRIDEKRLQRAVIASFDDLPQLCGTFVKGKWKETEEASLFQIEINEGAFGKEDIAACFAETVLIKEPFQIKIVLFREEEKDTIAVVINHMLCDGIDMKRYLYLLCELYNAEGQELETSSRYIGLPRDISWVRKEKAKRRPMGQKPKRERIPMQGGKIPCFLTETMPADKFALIEAYAKEHGVTVNDYFLAAYYKAVSKVYKYSIKTICCKEDLRGYAKEALGLSNQTGEAFCTVAEAAKLSFEELLPMIHERLEAEKENHCSLRRIKRLNRMYTHLPSKIFRQCVEEMATNPKVVFTNMGTLEEEKLSFGGIEPEQCYLTGTLKNISNLEITTTSYQGNVTLGINMMVSEKEKIRLTYFLQIYYVCLLEVVIP